MPTYDYRCQSCGSRFEVWQKITDEPVETCPTCGGPVRRVLYPVGLVFKGSGFYKTDHRESSTAAVPAGEPAANGTGTSESQSSESKSDTKPTKAAEPAKASESSTSTATATAGE